MIMPQAGQRAEQLHRWQERSETSMILKAKSKSVGRKIVNNVNRKIDRLIASGDTRRLLRLRDKLPAIECKLDAIHQVQVGAIYGEALRNYLETDADRRAQDTQSYDFKAQGCALISATDDDKSVTSYEEKSTDAVVVPMSTVAETIQEKSAAKTAEVIGITRHFRHSYSFESWCEDLCMGRKKKMRAQ